MLWHEQSWPQIQALDKKTPVVIPLGSCEQHGRHLPLIVDSLQVETVAREAEKQLASQILLTPTLWVGSSHHHLDFPGTISLPPSLYTKVLQEMVLCILQAGFTRIFLLNGHGGNEVPASQALGELAAENDQADAAYLVMASWWEVGRAAIAPQKHGLTTPFVSHADEYETSLLLALRPDLVHMEQIGEAPTTLSNEWFNFEYGGKVRVFRRFHRQTASGSMGRPSAGSAAKGQSMLTAVTADVVAFLRELMTWPDLPAVGPKEA